MTAKGYYIQLPIFGTDNKRAYYKLYLTLMRGKMESRRQCKINYMMIINWRLYGQQSLFDKVIMIKRRQKRRKRKQTRVGKIVGDKKHRHIFTNGEIISKLNRACSWLAQFRRNLPQPRRHWPRWLPRPPPWQAGLQ